MAARKAGGAGAAKSPPKKTPAGKSPRTSKTKASTAKSAKTAPKKPASATPPQPDPATTSRPPQPGPTEVLGQVSWLMMQSPAHKHLFFSDLEWLVVPALLNRQFRLFRQKGVPVAYASWAYLGAEADERMANGSRRLQPGDWNSGETLWLVDLIAPFGGGDRFLKELRDDAFEGKKVKSFQPAPDGKGLAIVEW